MSAVAESTVYRTKRRFVEGNLDLALSKEQRPHCGRKLSAREEALLIATSCSSPPEGRARWTLEVLAGEMVKRTEHAELSRETVRRRLKENQLKPWQQDMWCIPQVDGTYVARMEDVLDLYEDKPDRKRPVVCFDESPTQLFGEVRQPIPAAPGESRRYDYEYRRNGTMNLFVFLDAHRPWGTVKVTERRTAVDFAQWWRSPYWDPSWMRLRARSVRYSWEIAREDPHPQPLVRRSSGSYGSMEEAYANGSVALTRVRSSSASD